MSGIRQLSREVLHDALRFIDYCEAKTLTTGNRRLHSAVMGRLLPHKRWLLQELLVHHRKLGSLYRDQAQMAKKVAALYSTLIEHRNEQSRLYERKKQTNTKIGELVAKARTRLDVFNSELLALSTPEADARRAEIQELITQADAIFAERDRIDQHLDGLEGQINQVEAESKENREKFNTGEELLGECKEKVDRLKAILAGPAPTVSTQTDEEIPSTSSASTAVEASSGGDPSRKRHHSAQSALDCRSEQDEPVVEKKRHVVLSRKPSVGA